MVSRKAEPGPLDVRRAIDGGRLPRVWLWAGPETYLKDDLWTRVVAAVVPSGLEPMNVSRFRGGEDAAGAVVAACRTLPMMADRRAVLYRDVHRITKGDEDALSGYLRAPSPETVLVLMSDDLTRDARNRHLAEAGAEAIVFWKLFERDAVAWIRSRFRDLGKQCDPASARELLQACGAGIGEEKIALAEIAPEVEKVSLAMGGRTRVEPEDVTGIGRRIDEALRDEVLSAMSFGNVPAALRALDGLLLFKDWDEIRLVASLTYRMLALMRIRDAMDAGVPEARLTEGMRVWPKQREELVRAARGWTGAGLAGSLGVLARADRTLKSSGKPSRLVLEGALLTLAGLRAAGPMPSPHAAGSRV